jgi:aminomethyltransferase
MDSGYQALRESAAWFDVSSRGRIRAAGQDRARLLHAMTTNHVQGLTPGQGVYAFFLNAQGRILADVNILCFEDHLLLDLEPEVTAKIHDHLDKFIIADDVTLEDVTAQLASVAVEGPQSARLLEQLGAPMPQTAGAHQPWPNAPGGAPAFVARLSITGAEGYRFYVPAASKPELTAVLAALAPAADAVAVRTVRLEHGKPRYGEEITERYLAQETQQMHAVNFNKGCYLGQEIVERVRSRGQVHRHLLPLAIEGQIVPESGAKLQIEGKDAGEIASAVYSPALGRVVALAYVRTPHDRAGVELFWNGVKLW